MSGRRSDAPREEGDEGTALSTEDLLIQPASEPDPTAPAPRKPWTASEPQPGPPRKPAIVVPVDRTRTRARDSWWWRVAVVFALLVLAVPIYFAIDHVIHEDDPEDRLRVRAFTGTLVLESEPSGATVHLDDREVGTTPITVPDVPTGTRRLRFALEGHETHEGTVEIRGDCTRTVTQTLRAMPPPSSPREHGRLTLTSDPRAVVYFEGERLGETPLADVRLPAGVVRLELETPDGRRGVHGVVVRANDRTSAHVDLSEPP